MFSLLIFYIAIISTFQFYFLFDFFFGNWCRLCRISKLLIIQASSLWLLAMVVQVCMYISFWDSVLVKFVIFLWFLKFVDLDELICIDPWCFLDLVLIFFFWEEDEIYLWKREFGFWFFFIKEYGYLKKKNKFVLWEGIQGFGFWWVFGFRVLIFFILLRAWGFFFIFGFWVFAQCRENNICEKASDWRVREEIWA
jgi:hypothetical protein